MEIATSWMEQGLEKGLALGRQEGEFALVSRQLARKLGPLPDDLVAKLKALNLSELEALGEALLAFSLRADLEAWLSDHPSGAERA